MDGSLQDETVPAFFADLVRQSAYREVIEFGRRFGENRDASTFTCEAQAYVHLGKLDEATQAAEKAIEKDPSDIEPRLVLAEVLGQQPDKREAALEQSVQVCESARQDPRGWLLRSGILAQMGKKDEAMRVSEAGLAANPGDASLKTQLGCLLCGFGRFEDGLGHFEAALRQGDTAQLCGFTAMALESLGRFDEARTMFRRTIALDPNDLRWTKGLGLLLGGRQQYVEALEQFDRLERIAPNDADGWYLRAMALEALSRPDEAEAGYRRALTLDPNSPDIVRALGNLLGNRGRYTEALEYGYRLTKLSPDSPDGWLLAGQALGSTGPF
jgi:tetratricopeptide (TPR) repeat protein